MSRPSKRRETPKSTTKVSVQRLILSRPSSSSSTSAPRKSPKIPIQKPILSGPSSSSTSAPRKSPKIPIQKLILSCSSKKRPWSDLTVLVLERIRDLLDSTLYDVRLRSVCSNWRSSLAHPRQSRSPNFPIKLPDLPEKRPNIFGGPTSPVMLKYSCVYRVSSVDDPCHGWLFRSLDTTPNTFPLLHLFHIKRMICPPDTIPKSLDLLQVRISEVCKSYWLDGVRSYELRKVLLLPNFAKNIAFTVLVVLWNGNMYYCNDGDLVWTAIGDCKFHDLILFNGRCYAVSDQGCLFSLNSDFHLKEVAPAPAPPLDLLQSYNNVANNRLVSFESDLFLVSVLSERDFSTKTEVQIFKWMLNGWNRITDLSDTILLWCSSGVSVGVSAKDFKDCQGNCVYFTYYLSSRSYKDEFGDNGVTVSSMDYSLYDLDVGQTLNHRRLCRRPKMFWPPPKWMMQPT